ncbi:thiamine phosphate synthase [Salirhabdus salicampi]|uniref:thiamine phosphate synthase n=1 Tax=Salirhabdus salicampi TaxID=476102 RepID=UPI0020C268F8|nr:thiamine phosphate synthase [Salirhabdus salicampi]MCP8615855.1 thiamine phosphate synthase [Salirhabdus salicampi]
MVDRNKLSHDLKVYFIMGSIDSERNPVYVLEEAIIGGITMFQYREKGEGALTSRAKLELGREMQAICQTYNVPFIVNDDVPLAVELDADGVHIGQDDEPAHVVRKQIGRDKILGVSAHTIEEGKKAIEDGADYLGVGPIFPTQSKSDIVKQQDPSIIYSFRQNGLKIPIVGIGGITAENAHLVMNAGADGVSVISAISRAHDVKEATKSLRKRILD